jgi:trk system potassium uptake protein TrkA
VDVAVSTPRLLCALVEEAVTVGDLVRLFSFKQGEANLVEVTLPGDSPQVGRRVGDVPWPADTALVAILRSDRVLVPTADDPIESGDELVLIAAPEREEELQGLLAPHEPKTTKI